MPPDAAIRSKPRPPLPRGDTGGSPADNHRDYVTVREAVRLTGISERQWQRRATREAASGSRLAYVGPPQSGTGRPVWYVNRALDRRLARCPARPTRDESGRAALLERYPAHHVEAAYRKNHWLQRWRSLRNPQIAQTGSFRFPPCQGGIEGGPRSAAAIAAAVVAEAKRVEGADYAISVRSLQAWWSAYNQLGPDGRIRGVEALVPRYTNRQSSIVDRQSEGRSPGAVDYFYGLYHTEAKHSARACHDATVRQAAEMGWSWPSSYAATTKWLAAHDRRDVSCLRRDGKTAYSKRYLPHVEIDWTTIQPGDWYVADHTQADFWVEFEGAQIRPWYTTIMDCGSRCIAGWNLGDAPHQDAILAAMRMAFGQWAIPARFRIDQGKDFTSELLIGVTKAERRRLRRELGPTWRDQLRHHSDVFWLGVLGELGIDVITANPYSPWSKGIVERSYRTFSEQCAKLFETYCGNNPSNRPEALSTLRSRPDAVPSLDEARDRITQFIEVYHNTPHSGLDGATPLAIWRTATRLRRAVDNQLLALLQSRGVYRVGANGVSFRVGGRTMGYGAASGPLQRFKGRDVFVTLDPADCSCCHAYTPDRDARRHIARLEANERIPANTSIDELRRAIKSVQQRRKLFNRAAAESPRRIRNAAEELRHHQRARLAELRATGTDDCPPSVRGDSGGSYPPLTKGGAGGFSILPVRTGFESVSTPVQTTRKTAPPGEYDGFDIDDLDLRSESAGDGPADEYANVNFDALTLADPEAWDDDVDPYAGVDLTELSLDGA